MKNLVLEKLRKSAEDNDDDNIMEKASEGKSFKN